VLIMIAKRKEKSKMKSLVAKQKRKEKVEWVF
jgi:hypothetical protein